MCCAAWSALAADLSSPSALPLGREGRFEITPELMVADTVELLDLLRGRYGAKTFIAGFSFGATAPSKQLVWLERSAHTPQYDEPARFRDLLMKVTASSSRCRLPGAG
jgi:hypothetical protein